MTIRNKHRISAILVVALLLSCLLPQAAAPAYAAGSGSGTWPSFRGDPAQKGISAVATPRFAAGTVEDWAVNLDPTGSSGPVTNPILAYENIYVATAVGDASFGPSTSAKLLVFNQNGKVLKQKALPEAIGLSFSSSLGYGDGKLFLPVFNKDTNRAAIYAFDAKTLKQLWVSENLPVGYEIVSTILYRNGYLYSGASSGWSASSTTGYFFCLNTKDGDTARGDEVNSLRWTYTGNQAAKGYYMSGAVFTEKAVLFAGDDGVLVSHALTTSGAAIGTYAMDGSVRSDLFYQGGKVYAATQAGKVYQIPVSGAGKIDAGGVKQAALSGKSSTSAPVVYGGRLYAFSGQTGFVLGQDKGIGKLDVFNTSKMTKRATVDLGDCSQSSPLLTTAYATKKTKNTIYLYVKLNGEKDDVLCIKDSSAMAKPKVSTLYSPGGSFDQGSLIAGGNGRLYSFHSITVDPVTYATTTEFVSISTRTVTVKFNVNGGKKLKKASAKVAYGNTLSSLPTPVRKGYRFAGWYTKKSGGTKITANTAITFEKTMKTITFYAHWKKK